MDEDWIRNEIANARKRTAIASERYATSDNKFDYFDKAYYLGRAHSLEELLDHEDRRED